MPDETPFIRRGTLLYGPPGRPPSNRPNFHDMVYGRFPEQHRETCQDELNDFAQWRSRQAECLNASPDEALPLYVESARLQRYWVMDGSHVRPAQGAFDYTRNNGARHDPILKDLVGRKPLRVKTYFLGINHNCENRGPPILFETTVYDGQEREFLSQFTTRYSTLSEAKEGHRRVYGAVSSMSFLDYNPATRVVLPAPQGIAPISSEPVEFIPQNYEVSFSVSKLRIPSDTFKMNFDMNFGEVDYFDPLTAERKKLRKPRAVKIIPPSQGLTADERLFLEFIDRRFKLESQCKNLENRIQPLKLSNAKRQEKISRRAICLKDSLKPPPLEIVDYSNYSMGVDLSDEAASIERRIYNSMGIPTGFGAINLSGLSAAYAGIGVRPVPVPAPAGLSELNDSPADNQHNARFDAQIARDHLDRVLREIRDTPLITQSLPRRWETPYQVRMNANSPVRILPPEGPSPRITTAMAQSAMAQSAVAHVDHLRMCLREGTITREEAFSQLSVGLDRRLLDEFTRPTNEFFDTVFFDTEGRFPGVHPNTNGRVYLDSVAARITPVQPSVIECTLGCNGCSCRTMRMPPCSHCSESHGMVDESATEPVLPAYLTNPCSEINVDEIRNRMAGLLERENPASLRDRETDDNENFARHRIIP